MIKRWLLLLAITFGVNAGAAEPAPPGLFIVHFETGANWNVSLAPQDQPGFREHSANLGRLRQQGVIVFGARYDDLGMILLKADTLDSARALMDADPGVQAGIFTYRAAPFGSSILGRTEVRPPVLQSAGNAYRKYFVAGLLTFSLVTVNASIPPQQRQ